MITKTIHQIFFSVNGSKFNEHPIYIEGRKKWINWCKKSGYVYKFHTKKSIEKYYLNDPRIRDFYNNLRFVWQKIDFAKYLIINQDGGLYIDLDIYPRPLVNFKKYISQQEYIIGIWFDKEKDKLTSSNSILGFKKNQLNSLIDYSMEETMTKSSIPVYQTWVKRFMLQTTGVRMFMRWVKKYNLKYSIVLSDYIIDFETKQWNKNFG